MAMVMVSTVLGLIRQRLFLHYFKPEELSLFFAAFRLPDLVFQLLAYGMFSSALIPVFTKTYKKNKKEAFEIANRIASISLGLFIVFAVAFSVFAYELYSVFAPGYSHEETLIIVNLTRILLIAQGLFIVSYVLTGVLESLRRFFVPALAPILYNIGIILVTIMFAPNMGLSAPAMGAVFGAFLHLVVQAPLAIKLGLKISINPRPNDGVKKIAKLAAPRVLELAFLQTSKVAELYLTSIIASAALTYYSLADSVRVMPVTLFGVSLAKAALPTFSAQSDNKKKFRSTFLSTWYQIMFLVLPIAALLIVLRIPAIRLLFGSSQFDWESTVQTGLVLSVFAISIPFQASVALLSRAFFALHDTKTPVKVSMIGVTMTIILSFLFILSFELPTWSLSLAYSIGSIFQAITLYYLLSKRLNGGTLFALKPVFQSLLSATAAGLVMFFFIKFFDRSVWVKRLSFLGNISGLETLDFEGFVVDTRFTFNLLALTTVTAILGILVYVALQYTLGSQELRNFFELIKRKKLAPPPKKELETITPDP